jgi:serine/threonine protein kinase
VEDIPANEDEEGNFSISFSNSFISDREYIKRKVELEDFEIMRLIGKGGYGKVHQVKKKDSGEIYAMKVLRKEFLVETNNVTYTMTERNIMRSVKHPYIANLFYAFQTHGKVYLVMEFLNGGQLLYHMRKQPIFLEEHVKIYAAELVLALEYLHSQNIIHRFHFILIKILSNYYFEYHHRGILQVSASYTVMITPEK